MTTETIDKLFLELSLVTKAQTAREIALCIENEELRRTLAKYRLTAQKTIKFLEGLK